jgi:hypothetical protein
MFRAREIAQGATRSQASADLLNLGQLCEAFLRKNPDSHIEIQTSPTGTFQRLFICPGMHQRAVPVLLTNLHTDACFCKNKEFNFQIFSMSALTNQRSVFIYSFGIAPCEDEDNWTWFHEQHDRGDMGRFIRSGRAILRGDREKGQEAAANTVFPNTPKAACTYHIDKNMQRLHLFAGCTDRQAWRAVAEAATVIERDILWEQLQRQQPKIAAYLGGIDRVKWQTAELLQMGLHPHNTTTNNAAEQVCQMLLAECDDELPIRHRTPTALVRGLMELFSKQAMTLYGEAAVVRDSAAQYSDYALGIWSLENKESANYRVAQVGPREWAVVRMIVTDKVRHVKLDANGRAECECKLYDETEVMCRHIMAVARSGEYGKLSHLASNPFGAIWHNSLFVEAFETFTVLMPSPDEISACTGEGFPKPIYMPAKVKSRGRPRVKRINRKQVLLKKKMRRVAGLAEDGMFRHCSVCYDVGHSKTTCPVRGRFSSQTRKSDQQYALVCIVMYRNVSYGIVKYRYVALCIGNMH